LRLRYLNGGTATMRGEAHPLGATSILIAGDENSVVKQVHQRLGSLGYAVSAVVASGKEVIQRAKETAPDLVLVDVGLRGAVDGADVAEQIRARLDIPVVFLITRADDENLPQAKIAAPFGCVLEPFETRELHSTIETAIYEHKQEGLLAESRDRYRSLYNRVPVGLYRTRPDGKIVDANAALVEMLGYPDRKSLLEIDVTDGYVDAEDRKRWQALIEREGVVRGHTVQWRQRDGAVIWVRETTRAIRGADGKVVYYEGVVEDITEQVRAQRALLESQHRLESQQHLITRILDSIPSSLVVIDRSLQVVSANRNFLDKARRDASTTVGHRIEEVFPQVLLDYTRLPQKVQDIFRTGQPMEGGKVAYRAPGLPTRTYYYRLIPLKTEDAVENVMLLMDDITEREQLGEEVRRAERHLASVVECANDLVVSMDPQGCIVTWNQAAERTSGLKAGEAPGRSLLSLCTENQRPAMAEVLQRLAHGEIVKQAEVNMLTGNGREVPIAWNCSPMKNDAGELVGVVAVGRDLTERRQLEAQLIQSAKIASLGVMAGGIAHELRNPLAVVSASAQLLLERPHDEQLQAECAEKIYAAAQRASLIIEHLLKFARPQKERMREVDLHRVLQDTITLLNHQMKLQKISFREEFQPDLAMVNGNPDLLQQVFTNLILNARNAMPQGGVLTVATRTPEAGQVEIRFRDTGSGIPPENLPRIFDPFFTTMPVGKGTGLGLSISYSIVQQHQGTIKVESQVNQGTTVAVRLPSTDGPRVQS